MGVAGVWWVWANFTWFASSFDNDDAIYRMLVFVIIAGFTVFAGGIAYIFETLDARLGIAGWIIMRAGLVLLWLRAAIANPENRRAALIYAVGLTVLQLCWFVGIVILQLDSTTLYGLAAVLFLGEFAVPALSGRTNHPPLHPHHMVERHGLLNIIVLGEIILSASLFFGEMHGAEVRTDLALGGGITVAIVCMMWVYYFIEEDHLEAIETGDHFVSWAYLHLIVYFAAALFGAASAAQLDVLNHHSEADPLHLSLLTNGAIAIYIFGIWLIRDRFLQHTPTFWIPLVSVAVFIFAGALQAPYWTTSVVLLVALHVRLIWTRTGRLEG